VVDSTLPGSMVTSSATTDMAFILVGLVRVERTVECLPMMLSSTSASSPIIVLSMIEEFSITAFLPIFV